MFLTAKMRDKDLGIFVEPASESLSVYLDRWLADVILSSPLSGYWTAALVLVAVAMCAWVLDAFEMIFVVIPFGPGGWWDLSHDHGPELRGD